MLSLLSFDFEDDKLSQFCFFKELVGFNATLTFVSY